MSPFVCVTLYLLSRAGGVSGLEHVSKTVILGLFVCVLVLITRRVIVASSRRFGLFVCLCVRVRCRVMLMHPYSMCVHSTTCVCIYIHWYVYVSIQSLSMWGLVLTLVLLQPSNASTILGQSTPNLVMLLHLVLQNYSNFEQVGEMGTDVIAFRPVK